MRSREKEVEKIDSEEKFIQLVNQYQNLIFSICLKLTGDYFVAEDLTQDTFIAAYQNMEHFDGQAEKAWLCRIASNKCIDYQRAAARRVVPVTEEEMPKVHNTGAFREENEPLQSVLNREVLKELEACCNALSPPYDEVSRKYFLEGKTAKEITMQTGRNLKTVQTQVYRAREMLKKSYRKEMLKG